MEDCAGIILEAVSGQAEERDLSAQQMDELFHLAEQLEPMNLRRLDQETLNGLIVQLQTISSEIRHHPEETHLLMSLRKDILKDLQEAVIELLLALDQYDAQGRTRRFYQCLSTCRLHLEHIMERRLEAYKSAPEVLPKDMVENSINLSKPISGRFLVMKLFKAPSFPLASFHPSAIVGTLITYPVT